MYVLSFMCSAKLFLTVSLLQKVYSQITVLVKMQLNIVDQLPE